MVLLLAVLTAGTVTFAQRTIYLPGQSSTENLFNNPRFNNSNYRFIFQLESGNQMVLEYYHVRQAMKLPSIDSLIREVWTALSHFKDSLQDPLASRRIDVISGPAIMIRITNYLQRAPVYRVKGEEITQLKIEHDTVRIRMFAEDFTNLSRNNRNYGLPYFITFILNNVNGLPSLANGTIQPVVEKMKADIQTHMSEAFKRQRRMPFGIHYNVPEQRRITPERTFRRIHNNKEFIPYIQTGIQYIRGSWVPSAGVGFQLKSKTHNMLPITDYYRLFWEPYFVFNRNAENKVAMGRNDFVTFKYTNTLVNSTTNRSINTTLNFSASYLVHSSEGLFEPNTFKFSLPGLQYQNVLLEPEFIFNQWFKNFSPSLKLCVYFE